MKKIIIVGSPTDTKVIEAIQRIEQKGVEIIIVDNSNVDFDTIRKPFNEPIPFALRPNFQMPFFPKAKHLPKGHQKPYKFHR